MRTQIRPPCARLKARLKARARRPAFLELEAADGGRSVARRPEATAQGAHPLRPRRRYQPSGGSSRTKPRHSCCPVRFRTGRPAHSQPMPRAHQGAASRPQRVMRLPVDGAARRDAIRAAVLSPGGELRPRTGTPDLVERLQPSPPRRQPVPVSAGMAPQPSERLLDLDELRRRLGGLGLTLAKRVLNELPVIRLGDRVLIREASLDEYIRALDALARQEAGGR